MDECAVDTPLFLSVDLDLCFPFDGFECVLSDGLGESDGWGDSFFSFSRMVFMTFLSVFLSSGKDSFEPEDRSGFESCDGRFPELEAEEGLPEEGNSLGGEC